MFEEVIFLKLINILLLSAFLVSYSSIQIVSSEEKPPKSVCIAEYKKQWTKYNERVLTDIINSFDIDLSNYVELKRSDLYLGIGEKMSDNYDKISLQHLFVGSSRADMRLFLENGLKGSEGFFLFKRTDGTNVMKKLAKKGDIWVVIYVKEFQARKMKWESFDWSKCQKD